MTKPYAVLGKYGQSLSEYYIRLNGTAAKLLKDKNVVKIAKTTDGKYIVLEPVDRVYGKTCRKVTFRGRREENMSAFVFVSAWVSMTFFDSDWFVGNHYKVKKDKYGKIYVCLDEITKEGEA